MFRNFTKDSSASTDNEFIERCLKYYLSKGGMDLLLDFSKANNGRPQKYKFFST